MGYSDVVVRIFRVKIGISNEIIFGLIMLIIIIKISVQKTSLRSSVVRASHS